MRTQTESVDSRMQYDTDGNAVGMMVRMPGNKRAFLLEPGFLLVKRKDTGEVAVWDRDRSKLVEFAGNATKNT